MQSVTYGRISRVEAKNETVESIEEQIAECDADAEEAGDTTVATFKDNMTASDFKLKDRPDYQKLVAMVRAGEVDVIRVTEQSRLDREMWNVLELIQLARTTPLRQIRLVRQLDTMDLSTETGINRTIDQANRDRHEAWVTSERTKRKKMVRAKQGSFNGGTRPYGYNRVFVKGKPGHADYIQASLSVNEHEAAIIRDCAQKILKGRSLRSIVAELNANGETTVRDRRWQQTSLRKVFDNKCILGIRVHLGVEHEASWPPILDRETWDAVQRALAAKANYTGNRLAARKYLLTGMVRCGECGARLTGFGDGTKGQKRRRYFCRKLDSHGRKVGCGGVGRLAEPIEALVTRAVLDRFDGEGMSKAWDKAVEGTEMTDALAEYKDAKASLAELLRDYYQERDKYAKDEMLKLKADLQARLEKITRRMSQIESTRALASVPIGQTMREAWETADQDLRRSFVELLIERIIVHAGRTGAMVWTDPSSEQSWRFDPTKIEIVWRA